MVSLVENHRSCRVSTAYWKQARAKERMDFSVLWAPCHTAGPSTVWTATDFSSPPSPWKVMVQTPGWVVTKSTLLYTSP